MKLGEADAAAEVLRLAREKEEKLRVAAEQVAGELSAARRRCAPSCVRFLLFAVLFLFSPKLRFSTHFGCDFALFRPCVIPWRPHTPPCRLLHLYI